VKPTDVRIKAVALGTEDYTYRTPIKFGGVALDRATLLNVEMTVETVSGQVAMGFGSMPLGNIWAWPSRTLRYEQTLEAMKEIADRVGDLYEVCELTGHPIQITQAIERAFFLAANGVAEERGIGESVPHLATLVAASPFDAALHDAYGKVHGLNCYQTYGPEFLSTTLDFYLGPDFAHETLDRYVTPTAKPRMPMYHLVGALDPLTPADVAKPVGDGYPETLTEWIQRDGLTHLKIKLNGDDLGWDVERVVRVNAVAEEADPSPDRWHYSLDFNERCRTVEYLVEFLHRLHEQSPSGFDRVQYVEQPTARDLKADRTNVMHEAAKLRPVVIDESLTDLESLQLARDMGYTGVAFKACKGQTQSLLLAAAAQKFGMFRCVQDLTCVGASLIHSAGIAAHIPGVAAIESNGRQYMPAANAGWDERFPGVFTIRDGMMRTECLDGPGLGAVG
jgi:L-alanine-DL-glutamate epimerase-like enolase superfamily enzyme